MKRFPQEILDQIAIYLKFEEAVAISDYAAMKGRESLTPPQINGFARSGNLAALKWLHRHRSLKCTGFLMDHAAGKGHMEVLKWLHDNRKEGCTYRAMD